MESLSHNFKVDDMVTFLSEKKHKEMPMFYPPVGTIGRVIKIIEINEDEGNADCEDIGDIMVDWGEESGTEEDHQWWCNHNHIEAADLKKYNEEIKKVKKENIMKYEIGKKVRFVDEDAHEEDPTTFPPVGTIGTIVEIDSIYEEWPCKIDWGEKSGVSKNLADDGFIWWVQNSFIEMVDEVDEKLASWVNPDTEVPSEETEEIEEIDDVAALAELIIKKQMEIQKLKEDIQKLKEDNERLYERNFELNEIVINCRNLGLQIINAGANRNV
jgi:hypothetical protein